MSFATVTTSTETIPATSSGLTYGTYELRVAACQSVVAQNGWQFYAIVSVDNLKCYARVCNIGSNCTTSTGSNPYWTTAALYFPTLSYTCPAGYTLSGTNCIKETTVDSCTEYAGQSNYFWVSKKQAPTTVCSGSCLATIGSYGDLPDADPDSYTQHPYTYTGETGQCTSDTGFVDDVTAAVANAAAAERERLAKIAKAIADAKAACGGEGHYTTGTFNGATIVSCKDTGVQTAVNNTSTSTTVTNADGSTTTTTTTTTNNSSTTNNNSTTTVNSDGSTSTSGGASGSTSGTTTSVVTRAPDGTVISSSTSGSGATSGGVGTCSTDDMADTAMCAEFGEIPEGGEISEDTVDLSNLVQGASWWSNNSACIPDVQIIQYVTFSYQPLCDLLAFMRPIIIGVAFIIAAFITLGFNKKEGD